MKICQWGTGIRLGLMLAVTGVVAAASNGAPHEIYYYDQPRALELNVTQVALFNDPAVARVADRFERASLVDMGIDWVDNDLVPIPGWAIADAPAQRQTDAGVVQLVNDLAMQRSADFVSPVFYDDFGGPLIPTRDMLVGFDDGIPPELARAIIQGAGVGIVSIEEYSHLKGIYKVRSSSRNGFEVMSAANALAVLPQVRFAEPDMIFTGEHHLIPDDPLFDLVWGVHNTGQASGCGPSNGTDDIDMNGPEAWDLEQGDAGIIVVIIDSGYELAHPDLNHSGLGADFTGEGGAGAPVHFCDQHGTAVAGCVSGIINNTTDGVGIAPGCTVASARPFIPSEFVAPCSGNWGTTASWTTDALNWAQAINARVTNNSNGYGFTNAGIEAAYAATKAAGIVHFASAGNSGAGSIGYPSSIPEVNSISAIEKNGNLTGFSQFGPGLDFCAPGQDVLTTDRTGADGYDPVEDWTCVNGTSFSSPYASGVAALVLSVDPTLTPVQVEQILADTAKDLGAAGYDETFGWGLVNAFGAVQDALGIDCNGNGVADSVDILDGTSQDCNSNNVPDECDVDPLDPDGDGLVSPDCQPDGVPDECQLTGNDCNTNGVPDECDIADGTSEDCNTNNVPDECDIAAGTSEDCNTNSIPDECDIASGFSQDCQPNGVPDECDIADGTSQDCNNNTVPDECDIASGFSQDCQPDGVPDECQLGNCLNQYAGPSFGSPYSDIDCQECAGLIQVMAEDFVIDAASSLTGVRFWGGYALDDTAAVLDRFSVGVYADAGGLPGASLASFGPMEADLKLDSGITGGGGTRVFEYTLWFNVPVALGAGTYWVQIYNDTSGSTDSWYWYQGVFDAVHTRLNSAGSFTVPEAWAVSPFQMGLVVYCDEPDNDCNTNGIPDECELGANDCNNNGIPDDCETKPEYDPTVAIPHKQCQDADFVCPDILYLGSTTPLGPGTSLPLTCSFYFGVFDTFYAYRPAWDGLTFIRVEGPPTQFLYAVYEGCPAGPQNLIRCNESNHFELVFDAKKGETYYIRIAGTFYTYGDFEMELVGPDCLLNANDTNANGIPDECECLQDVDGNGVVDMADYIAVLIAFGPCAGCPEDVDGDGNVDASDAIEVFLNQGPCPFPGPIPPAQDLEQAERGSLIGAQPQRPGQRPVQRNAVKQRLETPWSTAR